MIRACMHALMPVPLALLSWQVRDYTVFFVIYAAMLTLLWDTNNRLHGEIISGARLPTCMHARTIRCQPREMPLSALETLGTWPYPFLERMTTPQRLLFYVAALG